MLYKTERIDSCSSWFLRLLKVSDIQHSGHQKRHLSVSNSAHTTAAHHDSTVLNPATLRLPVPTRSLLLHISKSHSPPSSSKLQTPSQSRPQQRYSPTHPPFP